MGELRVLIADDSEFMRVANKRIIEDQSSMQIVAMASNGAAAGAYTHLTLPTKA